MGFFSKVKGALKRTKEALNTDVRDLFKAEGRLVDDEFLDDLLEILVKTDMGVKPAQVVVDDIERSEQCCSVSIEGLPLH